MGLVSGCIDVRGVVVPSEKSAPVYVCNEFICCKAIQLTHKYHVALYTHVVNGWRRAARKHINVRSFGSPIFHNAFDVTQYLVV